MKPAFIAAFGALWASIAFAPALDAAQTKTEKECQTEWRANRTDNQAKGITEKAYVAQCRAGGAANAAATSGAAAPAAVQTPPPKAQAVAPAPAATAASAKPAPKAVATPTGANQFAAENLAKTHCPSDTVVWANTGSKIYHFTGYKEYGNTKTGAYMCEKDAAVQGFRASKAEKHPG